MDRRQLMSSMLAACAAATTQAALGAQPHDESHGKAQPLDHSKYHDIKHEKVVLIAYPGMTAMDLLGPQHMLSCMMGAHVMIAAQTLEAVTSDTNLQIVPDTDFSSCPHDVDLFLVPGGLAGTTRALKDERMIEFVAELGTRAKFSTSVCTGSLILGAAGLLKGYRATSHWFAMDMLRYFGATPVHERVVIDRNRVTGAGVTAGLDMGLAIVKMLRGEEYAKMIALLAEYDPDPPVHAGNPRAAGPKITSMLKDMYRDWFAETSALVSSGALVSKGVRM
jgi:cyclohexyl-isocyanide hydratase